MQLQGGRFLIIGGASPASSHIADALLSQGASLVRCFDNFSLGSGAALIHLRGNERVEIVRGDMLRLENVIEAADGIDGVFLVAAYLAGPLASDLPVGIEVNTRGVQNVLDACRFNGIKRMVYSSSVGVYGNAVNFDPITEETPYVPQGVAAVMSIYSASKMLAEGLCRLYEERHGIHYMALRYSSIYGPRQHSHSINALPVVEIYDSIVAGRAPRIRGDGEEVHDYLYMVDLARANAMAMASDKSGHAITVASGRAWSVNDIARELLTITGSNLVPFHEEEGNRLRFTTSNKLRYSIEKAKELLGWEPEVMLGEGLAEYVQWRKKSQQ